MFDEIKYFVAVLRAKISSRPSLLFAEIEIIAACNLKCSYCYGRYFENPLTSRMSFETFEKNITKLKKQGLQRLFLTGGEPLLHPEIDAIVSLAKQLSLNVGMVTNGLLIHEHIRSLSRLDSLIVSLDGRKGPHEINRGQGSFDKVFNNILLLREHKIPFKLKAVLNTQTFSEIDWLLAFAKENKTEIEFVLPYDSPLSVENRKLLLKIIDLKKRKAPIMFSLMTWEYIERMVPFLDPEKKYVTESSKKQFQHLKCFSGEYHCFMTYKGDLYPCNYVLPHFVPQNIETDDFSKACEQLRKHDCLSCPIPFLQEKNFIHNLSWKYLVEYLKRKISI